MIYVGTSGYFYNNWVGEFYPPGLPSYKWLEYYFEFFNSLELNSTFYRFPKLSTVKNWKYKIKENCKLSVKANRVITHDSKLTDLEKLKEFLKTVSILENKLGAVLFQLPPSLKYEKGRFLKFIDSLNKNLKYAVEFRDKSWYNEKVYEILRDNNIALVWHDFNGDFIFEYTADFNYVRFHGYTGKYKGSYPDRVLKKVKSKLLDEAYVYFNNTADNSAFKDAKRFMEL